MVTIILMLAGAIIIFIFISGVTKKSTFDEAINTCRFSVLGQSATNLKIIHSPFNINCEKRYIKIYNTKVEVGLNPSNMQSLTIDMGGKKVTRFKELTDLTVDQVLAEEMRICKYQFAEGKMNVFVNDGSFWANKNICFVCSEIDFDPSVRKQTFDTLVEYTNKTTFDDTKTTYYNYLTENGLMETPVWAQPTNDPSFWSKVWGGADTKYGNLSINTNKTYVIYFEKYMPSTINIFQWTNGYWVVIQPLEDINKYCQVQAT